MILFLAAQDLRTPLSYNEWMSRWRTTLPALLKRTMQESTKELEEAREQGIVLTAPPVENEFSDLFKITIEPSGDSSSEKSILRSTIVAGRRLWIAAMRHLLSGMAKRLCEYRWSVAEPYRDAEWPLTDHPVLRLNYNSPKMYDFQGGWGSPGTEIMMPVSPKHLLYVQVGRKHSNRFTISPERTQLVQRFLVERAHRWVFATRQEAWVTKVITRHVDPEVFAAEEKAWEEFHPDQLQSEMSSRRSEDPEED